MADNKNMDNVEETVDQTVEQPQDNTSKKKESKKDLKKIDELQKKVEELEKKNAELTDKLSGEHNDYLKLMAEFETFRRRTAEDRLNLIGTASADTIKELFPALDACEQALKMLENTSDESALKGTQLIYENLMACLKKRGLEKIEALGAKFDADIHEAITMIPMGEDKKGIVVDVTRTGYVLNGKVVRYPQVVVGA